MYGYFATPYAAGPANGSKRTRVRWPFGACLLGTRRGLRNRGSNSVLRKSSRRNGIWHPFCARTEAPKLALLTALSETSKAHRPEGQPLPHLQGPGRDHGKAADRGRDQDTEGGTPLTPELIAPGNCFASSSSFSFSAYPRLPPSKARSSASQTATRSPSSTRKLPSRCGSTG